MAPARPAQHAHCPLASRRATLVGTGSLPVTTAVSQGDCLTRWGTETTNTTSCSKVSAAGTARRDSPPLLLVLALAGWAQVSTAASRARSPISCQGQLTGVSLVVVLSRAPAAPLVGPPSQSLLLLRYVRAHNVLRCLDAHVCVQREGFYRK